MKKAILALIVLAIVVAAAAPNFIGGPNSTIEAMGGLRSDSAFQLPAVSTTMRYTNKGVGTTGLVFENTADSLPYYMKNNVVQRIFTGFSRQIFDTANVTISVTDTVLTYSASAGTYVISGYVDNTTATSGSVTTKINYKDEANTQQSFSASFQSLGTTGITVGPSVANINYYMIAPTIHCHADSKIYISVNTGSGITASIGYVVTKQ